jgi:hypothetical protein
MQYSKEKIFQMCNLHKHCIAAYLKKPINVNGHIIDVVNILSLVVNDTESEMLLNNIANSINTNNGSITVQGFTNQGNPRNPHEFTIPLDYICEIESYNI